MPDINPREAIQWRHSVGSAEWVLAVGSSGAEIAFRQLDAPQWGHVREDFLNLIPRAGTTVWTAVAGDGAGGFWLGSDAGLHFLLPESGSMKHHVAPMRTTISGGWGRTFGPHFLPSSNLLAEIQGRQAEEVRSRMRDRARLARISRELRLKLDPITPTSRIPGPVRVLLEDGPYLWIATADPLVPDRSRVLLLHAPSQKWLGWFLVPRPVTAMAVDTTHLYVGIDIEPLPRGAPLFRLEKARFIATPEIRRVADLVTEAELGPRLAALPLKERAVFAFFAGDPRTVVDLLANAPQPDAESLFLLAFAHDAAGLDDSTRHAAYLEALVAGYPDHPLTAATAGLRQSRTAVSVAPPLPPPPPARETSPPSPASFQAIMARRDLNRDGKLNLIEFRLWQGPNADLKRFDLNGDGFLDAAELEALPKE